MVVLSQPWELQYRILYHGGDIAGGPYNGVVATVPGVFEVEEFDEGVQGLAYSDTTPGTAK